MVNPVFNLPTRRAIFKSVECNRLKVLPVKSTPKTAGK